MPKKPDELPDAAGAYLLLISIRQPTDLPSRFGNRKLLQGTYGYAGSAYGPGGIRARCRRHLTGPPTRHWHIDWLTSAPSEVQALAFPADDECRLIKDLVAKLQARCPINGFGSTDCKRCSAHLVQLAPQLCHDDIVTALLPK